MTSEMQDSAKNVEPETRRWVRVLLWFLRPRIAVPGILCLGLILAPFIYRNSQLRGLPDIGDPFDIEKFGKIADADNAAIEYRAAVAILDSSNKFSIKELDQAEGDDWSALTQSMKDWLQVNRPALELWHQGTQKPDALFMQPCDQSISMTWIQQLKHRDFMRLAILEAKRLAANGDHVGAWKWYRSAIRYSRHLGRHGMLIPRQVGMGRYLETGKQILVWSQDAKVEFVLLKQALSDLTDDFKMTQPVSLALTLDFFVEPQKFFDDYSQGKRSGFRILTEYLEVSYWDAFIRNEPEFAKRVYRHVLSNLLTEIDSPRHLQSPATNIGLFENATGVVAGTLSADKINEHYEKSELARILLISYLNNLPRWLNAEQARHANLRVALAAQCYFRDHAQLPETIADLTPGYLDQVPMDAFIQTGQPIKYRREANGQSAVVWSVGDDKIDDSGAVVPMNGRTVTDIGYIIRRPSSIDSP